jgi:hypothetical protein
VTPAFLVAIKIVAYFRTRLSVAQVRDNPVYHALGGLASFSADSRRRRLSSFFHHLFEPRGSPLFWNLTFILGVLVTALSFSPYEAKAHDSDSSHLGAYGQTSTYCGSKPIQQNPTTIPQIGCFVLSAGHSATATIATHNIEVSVDTSGNENFKADGVLITTILSTPTQTNLSYVNNAGSGMRSVKVKQI